MAFRSSSSNTGSASSGTVPVPSGAASGDIAIITALIDAFNGQTFTWPSGFTQFHSSNIQAPDGQCFGSAWKRLTGADSGNYSLSWTDSQHFTLICALFSGRHATDPPVSNIATDTNANSSPISVNATGVTAVAGDDLHWSGGIDVTSETNTSSCAAPSTFTEREDTGSNTFTPASVATKDNVSAGATGTITGVFTTTVTAGWFASLVRIPAAAAAAAVSMRVVSVSQAVKRASYW